MPVKALEFGNPSNTGLPICQRDLPGYCSLGCEEFRRGPVVIPRFLPSRLKLPRQQQQMAIQSEFPFDFPVNLGCRPGGRKIPEEKSVGISVLSAHFGSIKNYLNSTFWGDKQEKGGAMEKKNKPWKREESSLFHRPQGF